MKLGSLIALLFIGGVVYYATGGGALFGLSQPAELPESIDAPNATFMGDEQANPFAQ